MQDKYNCFNEIQKKLAIDKEFAKKFYNSITDAIIPYNDCKSIKKLGEPVEFKKLQEVNDVRNK